MATTSNSYTGNGSTVLFSFTFPYLDTTDIKVSLNGVNTTAYTLDNATTIRLNTAPASGVAIKIYRVTGSDQTEAEFYPGSAIRSTDLNRNFLQTLYVTQETQEVVASSSSAGLQSQITAANNTANTAIATANSANATANGIAGTANTALTNSSSAVTTAGTALSTANAASATANSISSVATSAQTTANTAVTNAATAQATANAALPLTGGTLTGNLTIPSLNGGQLAGNRNRILNGDMLFYQRFTGTNPIFNVGSAYILDRWIGYATIAGNMRISQSTDAPAGFTVSQKVEAVTGATIGAADYFLTSQKIEGYNVSDFNFGTANAVTVTLSFWVKCSVTGTHSGVLRNSVVGGSYRGYPFTYSISAANTWEKKSIVIPGDTTGTWSRAAGVGIEIVFDHGTGTTYRGTAGAYTSSTILGVAGSASPLATAGATWLITGVQLERGTVATPYEYISIPLVAINLQRYYAAMSAADTLPVTAFTDQARGFFKLPTSMRVVPTCTFTYDIGGGATWAIGINGGFQVAGSSNVSGFGVRAEAEL